MNTYDDMLARYQQNTSTATPNAEQEVMQQIALGISKLATSHQG